MKSIIKKSFISFFAGIALLLGITTSSCTDLTEIVYDQIPSSDFPQTQAQINSIIGPVYKTLKSVWPGDMFCLIEQSADMAVTPTRIGGDWWDGGAHMEVGMHTWSDRNNLIRNSWNSCVNGIGTCNRVLMVIEESNMEPELKAQTLGEIRGVRAYWYYMLIDLFGNAPLSYDYKDLTVPGITSRADLYTFVMNELNAIKDVVRSDVTAASYGKFTRGAAYTLLAKMHLNAEVWRGTPNWQGVIDACDEVMKLDYIIEPDWKINFAVKNDASREIILPVMFSAADGGNQLYQRTLHYLAPPALGFRLGTWNGMSANSEYVKEFDVEDRRLEWSFLIGPLHDPVTGEVIITAHNRPLIHTVDFNIIEGTERYLSWGDVHQEEGARVNKWEFEQGLANTDQNNHFPIFRLADVYLMKAEALLRLGQNNAEATRLINVIRERGFGHPDKNYTSATLEDLRLERRFELAWECHSRQDQIRFGTFLNPTMWRQPSEEYRKLFPIPYTAWQANNRLTQNPGYPAFQ